MRPATEEAVIAEVRTADEPGEDLLIVGGGSNLVISDGGFPGTVVRIANPATQFPTTVPRTGPSCSRQAGQPWDELVEATVAQRLAGLEALSGIPGLDRRDPVQNVGRLRSRGVPLAGERPGLGPPGGPGPNLRQRRLGFGYRDSLLKRTT